MLHGLIITVVSILCPPLAVLLLTGCGVDFAINCALFVLGVIPSHLHAIYISCTFFNRKRKVMKGKWPGSHRGGISSEIVQNGGADEVVVKRLEWQDAQRREEIQSKRRWTCKSSASKKSG